MRGLSGYPGRQSVRVCAARLFVLVAVLAAAFFVTPALAQETGCAASPDGAPAGHRIVTERPLMGTLVRITVVPAPGQTGALARAAMEAALDRIAAIERVASDYDPDSEASLLARAGGGRVSNDLSGLLLASETWHHATDGAFDAAMGRLTRLWRRAARRGVPPDSAAQANARSASGWHLVQLAGDSLALASGASLDFGGIAKGYAADRALDLLSEAGFPAAIVDVGGDLRIGSAPHGGWDLDIPGLPAAGLRNVGVAVSGDTFRGWTSGAHRISHILNPDSGEGLTDSPVVTVIASTATAADALASAVSVLGPERGRALAARHGASVLFTPDAP